MNVNRLLTSIFTITEFELRKLRHDFSQVFMRVVQPALWLLIFGEVLAKVRVLPTTTYSYLQFLTPGVLAQSVIFVAIFFGLQVVWERDLGLLHKLLSTPAPRYGIVIGKTFAAGALSLPPTSHGDKSEDTTQKGGVSDFYGELSEDLTKVRR